MLRPRALAACALTAAAVTAVAVPASSGAGAVSKTPVVTVADDYFAPTDVTVPKDSKVKWVWDDSNTDIHNVIVGKHPKRAKASDFRSADAAVGLTFAPRFKVPGTYDFVCTYHRGSMRMTVKVKK